MEKLEKKELRRAAIMALAAAAFGVGASACGGGAGSGGASATPVSSSGQQKVEKEPRGGDSHCGGH
ncbi:MAG: hypothetical protein ACXVEF_39125 [Polyangiales bacterium]